MKVTFSKIKNQSRKHYSGNIVNPITAIYRSTTSDKSPSFVTRREKGCFSAWKNYPIHLTLSFLALNFFPRQNSASLTPIHCRKPVAAHKTVQEPSPPPQTITDIHYAIAPACRVAWFWCHRRSTASPGTVATRLASIFLSGGDGHCGVSDDELGDGLSVASFCSSTQMDMDDG